MNLKKLLLSIVALSVVGQTLAQKVEGLALTPPMGWNSWNKFGCDISESLIREVADAMVESGLADAGFVYINLDDCWHAPSRDADGFPQCDPQRFPSGMKALVDYVHSKGLKIGIYSCAGTKTCAGKFGSYGHEYQDALQYARWGFDYLKYDWCYTDGLNAPAAYKLMSEALAATGHPILFSICEWGSNNPCEWAAPLGHCWRTTYDICGSFSGERLPGTWGSLSVLECLDQTAPLRKYAGPDHWNDPDMLEVGNGFTVNQDRAHFTMWCMLAAPLMLGNDIRSMSDETAAILLDKDVIAIDQDPLGVQGFKYLTEGSLEFWLKPLEGEDWALCILNRSAEPVEYTIEWQRFNTTDEEVSQRSTKFYNTTYDVRDLWNGGKSFTTAASRKVVVPGEDVILYRLTPSPAKKRK